MALSSVLITVPSLSREFGGPVTKAQGLAAALRAIGHPVTVVGVGSDPKSQGLPQLFRFHGTPVPARLKQLSRAVGVSDVVHVLGFRDPVGTAAAFMAHRAGLPYLLEPAGMHRRRFRSLALKSVFDQLIGQRVVRGAALMVATSNLEAAELEKDGVPSRQIWTRPNGIDADGLLPLPARGALRKELNFPMDVPVVLCVARITAKKGMLDFANALATLNGVWGIVAGPDDRDGTLGRLRSLRDRLGLAERLAILPHGLWGRDKAQAFADSDAFCLPSASENFGNAALESAAAGLPVVISDMCGAIEWLEPAATRVVPYADVRALAAALRDVLENPAAKQASDAAAPRIRTALSWSAVAKRQHEIYEGLVVGHA